MLFTPPPSPLALTPPHSPLRKWIANYQQKSKRAASPKTSGRRTNRGALSASFPAPALTPTSGQGQKRQASADNAAVKVFRSAISCEANSVAVHTLDAHSYSLPQSGVTGDATRQVMSWDGSMGSRPVTGMESLQSGGLTMGPSFPVRAASAPGYNYQHTSLLPNPLPTQLPYCHPAPHMQSYAYTQLSARAASPLRSNTSPLLPTPSPSNPPLLHNPPHHPAPLTYPAPLLSQHYSLHHHQRAVYPSHLSHTPPIATPAVTRALPTNFTHVLSKTSHIHPTPNPSPQFLLGTSELTTFTISPSYGAAGSPGVTAMGPSTQHAASVRLQPCYNFQGFTFDKKPILACLKP